MLRKEIEQIIYETLEKCGIEIPVEAKFDYSGLEQPDKAREFIRLTKGNLMNAIYVLKMGERNGDYQYFDLLFALNQDGEPVCIPHPVARKLFGREIQTNDCGGAVTGQTYETIYRHYYNQQSVPF